MEKTAMRMRVTLLLPAFAALFILTSCFRYGATADSFPPALTPKGILGDIVTNRTEYRAELIEVRETGIVLLALTTFRLVPYSAIRSTRFDHISASISNRKTPSTMVRERLRLVSRFPQGLSKELLEKLLSANTQIELAQENP